MSNIKTVVCPKCKAKLKFDPEKITAAVARFKCPGCKTVLRFSKQTPGQAMPPPQPRTKSGAKSGVDMEKAGAELMDLARQFEEEMGFEAQGDAGYQAAGEEPEPDASKKRAGDAETVGETAAADAKASNARKAKRVKFKKKVLVNNQIMVEALDISEDGLFLHTGRSFDDGTVVEVGIPTMPGTFDLRVKAMVRHNHRGIGMGLQFVELDDKDRAKLRKLVGELDATAASELEGRKKILLVGGTDTARNINKSKLVLDGFYVMQATTAEEVFTILQREPPDAMVLEWQEPKFNCKGLLARIKENPDYDAIIRVVLSALTDTAFQREIMAAGAHKYMAKMDTNPARLSQTLKQLIDERDG